MHQVMILTMIENEKKKEEEERHQWINQQRRQEHSKHQQTGYIRTLTLVPTSSTSCCILDCNESIKDFFRSRVLRAWTRFRSRLDLWENKKDLDTMVRQTTEVIASLPSNQTFFIGHLCTFDDITIFFWRTVFMFIVGAGCDGRWCRFLSRSICTLLCEIPRIQCIGTKIHGKKCFVVVFCMILPKWIKALFYKGVEKQGMLGNQKEENEWLLTMCSEWIASKIRQYCTTKNQWKFGNSCLTLVRKFWNVVGDVVPVHTNRNRWFTCESKCIQMVKAFDGYSLPVYT